MRFSCRDVRAGAADRRVLQHTRPLPSSAPEPSRGDRIAPPRCAPRPACVECAGGRPVRVGAARRSAALVLAALRCRRRRGWRGGSGGGAARTHCGRCPRERRERGEALTSRRLPPGACTASAHLAAPSANAARPTSRGGGREVGAGRFVAASSPCDAEGVRRVGARAAAGEPRALAESRRRRRAGPRRSLKREPHTPKHLRLFYHDTYVCKVSEIDISPPARARERDTRLSWRSRSGVYCT